MDNLIKQLQKLPKKRLPRRADFHLRFKLYKMIWQKRLDGFRQSVQLRHLKPVPALIIILLCLFVIVPGYAYASNQVTRSHPLYPLKQGMEKVEVSLALSAPAKANTYTKLTDRRLAEAEVLSEKNQSQALIETINEATRLAEKADEETQNITEEQKQSQVQATINQAKETQQNTLATIAHTVGIKAEEKVLDSIALAFEAVKPKRPEDRGGKDEPTEKIHDETMGQAPTSSPEVLEEEEGAKTDQPAYPLPTATDAVRDRLKVKKQELEDRQQEAPASFNQLKNKVEDLKTDITEEEYELEDVDALFDRLNNKMEQAQKSWQDHNLNNFDGLIKSTEALTNNARHFIKSKTKTDGNNRQNFGQISDNDEDANIDEVGEEDEKNKDENLDEQENNNKRKSNNRWGD
jgi:hypothetical protein